MNLTLPAVFTAEYWNIPLLDQTRLPEIQQRIDAKTKPMGALGQLESIAKNLSLTQGYLSGNYQQIQINHPSIMIFAADHGIAANGVSIAPSAVTGQMVANFLAGGAAINCFCDSLDIQLKVVDAGMLSPVEASHPILINQPIGAGTADFSKQAAMTTVQAQQCLIMGEKAAKLQLDTGTNLLGFGEMGIGNTSAASALFSALTGLPAEQTTGAGTGITAEQLAKKIQLISLSQQRVKQKYAAETLDSYAALMEVGGFEIGQIVGAMLATASAAKTILVDGFIVSVAALIAIRIAPQAQQFMLFAHCSAENAHLRLLKELKATPMLDLGLRLGEGTGAALAVPLLRVAGNFYNNMATFDSAQVTV
ncbi:nicotinate-nucleotide--dimethylbenzimidazole phosphoribosyltransferase [uncultured Paraglaciecola sp.]|uniref:nicotinate-nucleotide--dimethylbenzimidazole phosphoribosyltransferase n=1 Tax=uncultured Paraglaciecola sp. TaxID=1765024 RepID=UPI0030DDDD6C|tara:strand:- start:33569 stop:34663 length:1095 start_codon:yes stop_codon:yes gene_type:complete